MAAREAWPELPYDGWKDTCITLQLWTQIVGKIRMALAPRLNHTWHVTLYVTCRGLTTSAIPCGDRTFQIDFDFIDHRLFILTSQGAVSVIPLTARPVAEFYHDVMAALQSLDIHPVIRAVPDEMAENIPFEDDREHRSYDSDAAHRFWMALVQSDRVLKQFRARFIGKCSPVHFFWGASDLTVTRFSGRRAPLHPGGIPHLPDRVVQDAYSHEVSSAGFWPGGDILPEPVFYSYAYLEPAGFKNAAIQPDAASYHEVLREFILPYEAVRTASAPDEVLLSFLQSTYEAAANAAGWRRAELEWDPARL